MKLLNTRISQNFLIVEWIDDEGNLQHTKVSLSEEAKTTGEVVLGEKCKASDIVFTKDFVLSGEWERIGNIENSHGGTIPTTGMTVEDLFKQMFEGDEEEHQPEIVSEPSVDEIHLTFSHYSGPIDFLEPYQKCFLTYGSIFNPGEYSYSDTDVIPTSMIAELFCNGSVIQTKVSEYGSSVTFDNEITFNPGEYFVRLTIDHTEGSIALTNKGNLSDPPIQIPEGTITADSESFVVTSATLNNIQVTTRPTKLTYNVGDTLDTSGLVVTGYYSDGTQQNVTSKCTCSPTVLTTEGEQTITVSYNENPSLTSSFTVTVSSALPTFEWFIGGAPGVPGEDYTTTVGLPTVGTVVTGAQIDEAGYRTINWADAFSAFSEYNVSYEPEEVEFVFAQKPTPYQNFFIAIKEGYNAVLDQCNGADGDFEPGSYPVASLTNDVSDEGVQTINGSQYHIYAYQNFVEYGAWWTIKLKKS